MAAEREAEADLRIPCELYIVAAHISRPVVQKKDSVYSLKVRTRGYCTMRQISDQYEKINFLIAMWELSKSEARCLGENEPHLLVVFR